MRLKGFRTRVDFVQHNPVGLVMRYDYLEFQRTLVTISFGVPFGSTGSTESNSELRFELRYAFGARVTLRRRQSHPR